MQINNTLEAEIAEIIDDLLKEMKNFNLEDVGVTIDFVDPYNNTIVVPTRTKRLSLLLREEVWIHSHKFHSSPIAEIISGINFLLNQPLKYWTDRGDKGLLDFPDMITIDIKGKPTKDAQLGHGGFASVLVSKPENSTIFNKALGVLYIEENGELLAEIGVRPYSETWHIAD